MAEPGDPSVPRCKIAFAAAFGTHHQFDAVAGRVAKADEPLDLALIALAGRAHMHGMPEPVQRIGRQVQRLFVFNLEGDSLFRRIAFEIAQGMSTFIRPQVGGARRFLGDFQPQVPGGEINGRGHVARTKSRVRDVLEFNHISPPLRMYVSSC